MSCTDAPVAAYKTPDRAHPALLKVAEWLVYSGMVVCSVLKALVGGVYHNADAVAYLDLSDAFRDHRWHALVNGYWFPGYPALLTLGRSLFGFRLKYDLMAARLVTMFAALLFVAACVALGAAVRRLMLSRGIQDAELLPERVLYLWVAGFSYFCAWDFVSLTADALVSAFMVLAVASLVWSKAGGGTMAYVGFGVFAALAFLTKTFALSFFILLILASIVGDLPRWRNSLRLALSVLLFGILIAPYVWELSASKGRLSFGDTGKLAFAWYVNGADRFNPVDDPSICHHGTARIRFKHPGELLARSPEIAYFSGDHVQGSMPQWDDPSFWWDGMSPRVNVRQMIRAVSSSVMTMFSLVIMRFQGLLFIVFLYLAGYALQRRSWVHSVLPVTAFVAVACIGLYAMVLMEGRYIAFSVAVIGTLLAGSALARPKAERNALLGVAVSFMVAFVLTYGFQSTLREWKASRNDGAQPLSGNYDMPQLAAGIDLARRFSPGTEVACMGERACWADPMWARNAKLKITAVIESGNGWNSVTAETGCKALEQNPSVLQSLRERHVRAIVAQFDGDRACADGWLPISGSHDFFYRPL